MAIEARHGKGCPRHGLRKDEARAKRCAKLDACGWRGIVGSGSSRVFSQLYRALADAEDWERTEKHAAKARPAGPKKADVPTVSIAAWETFELMRQGTYLSKHRKPFKSRSIRKYEADFKHHIEPAIGDIRLDDLSSEDVQEIIDGMTLAPATICQTFACLYTVYRRYVKLVPHSPMVGLEFERPEKRRIIPAKPHEVKELMTALPLMLKTLYGLAIYAGLRSSEIVAIRWADIEWDDGMISITRQWDKIHGKFDTPKSGISRETILPDELHVILRTWRDASTSDDLIFSYVDCEPHKNGRRQTTGVMRIQTLMKQANVLWRQHGLEPIGMHKCRHTFVSQLARDGVDAKSASIFAGHASVAYTYDKYGHMFENTHADTVKKLRAVRGTTPAAIALAP